MRGELLADLESYGCTLSPEGDNIRVCYDKKSAPPEALERLLEGVKLHKSEIMRTLKARDAVKAMAEIWKRVFTFVKAKLPEGFKGTPEIRALAHEIAKMEETASSGNADTGEYEKKVALWERMVMDRITEEMHGREG